MKGYLICLFATLILAYISEKSFKNNKDKFGMFFLVLCLLFLAFFAGIRNEFVGADIHTYVSSLFREYSAGNGLIYVYNKYGIEFGFSLLIYLFSLFKNLNFVLFGIELMVCIPVFIFCYKNRNKSSIVLNLFLFYTTMYCYSFSMMRQSIAISFGLLSLYYNYNNNKRLEFIMIIIAFLFHRTALILIIMNFILSIVMTNNKNRYFYLLIILAIFLVGGLLSTYVVLLLPKKYSLYLGNNYDTAVNFLSILKKTIWIVPIMFYRGRLLDKNSEKNRFLLVSQYFIILDLVIYLIGLQVPTVSRLSLYLSDISIYMYFPYIINMINPKLISKVVFSSMIVFFWWHMTAAESSANIYPYRSDIITVFNE